jgi:hypothetical protein
MKERVVLAALTLGCAIDARDVELNQVCVDPPASGMLADFSVASARGCPAGFCTSALVGGPAVVLGAGSFDGLVFPYAATDLAPMAVGVVETPATDEAAPGLALWGAIEAGVTSPTDDALRADGLALRFVDCVDTSAHAKLSFELLDPNATLDVCTLNFGLQFAAPRAATLGEVEPLLESNAASVRLSPGTVSLDLASMRRPGSPNALFGMQWEFAVPGDEPAGCSAYFRIDDIRLVR